MIESYIRDVQDFPKPGIVFKDITPLLQSPEGLRESIASLEAICDPSTYDVICGIESRGFIFGTALPHLPPPVKIHTRFLRPIDLALPASAADDPVAVDACYVRVVGAMQQGMDDLKRAGRHGLFPRDERD